MRLTVYPLALACLGLLAGPALAQSTAASSGQATAQAIAIAPGTGGYSGDPSGHSTSTQTIHNTPDVAVASYAGGTNPCGIGGTLGVAVAGFGIGGGIATTSHECSMRSWYVLLAATAEHAHDPAYLLWARGIACSNQDLKAVAPPGMCAPVAVAEAVSAPSVPVSAKRPDATIETARIATKPEWCYTVTAQDGPHPECR